MTARGIAVIAGAGLLPVYWVREAVHQGFKPWVICISEHAETVALRALASCLMEIGAGQLGGVLEGIQASGLNQAVILGRVERDEILGGAGPDSKMKGLLSRIKGLNAMTFFSALAEAFAGAGVELLDQTRLMESYLAGEGLLTRDLNLSPCLYKDMDFGFTMAKKTSELGIGQTVVVKDRAVVAVEAMEGTDRTIQRSGTLVAGSVVVKVAAPGQDLRFDVPTVGMNTLQSLIEAKVSALVLETGKTFILEKENFLQQAQENRIVIWGKRCEYDRNHDQCRRGVR